ncbi:MAG TPA: hypothetical protein VM491_11400 [Burkholderiaceae bacterium]|nr:hypothetical protein [Burkholderiaceae bacterium]
MRLLDHPLFVRRLLTFDAATSAAMGLALLAGAGALAPVLGLPETLLRAAGAVLLPFAALVGAAGARPAPSRRALRAIAGCNLAWALGSVALLAGSWVQPTAIGIAFVAVQAVAVAALGELQLVSARRSAAVPAGAARSAGA